MPETGRVQGADVQALARLREIFDQSPAFIATLRGQNHVFEMANAAYIRLIGNRDVLGKPVREALPETTDQGFIDILDRVYSSGEPFAGTEIPIDLAMGPDGRSGTRYLNFIYQPLIGREGNPTGILVHGMDVTELREARRIAEEQAVELESQAEELENQAAQLEEIQTELEASNDELARASNEAEAARSRLEAVLHQMPSGVVIGEAPSGRLILGNEQVERIWRRPFMAAAAVGEYDSYVGYHQDGRRYRPEEWPLSRSLRGERVMDEEIEIERGDDSRGILAMSSAPVLDGEGNVVAAVAIFDDITAKKRHEEDLAFVVEAARVLSSSLDYRETLRSVARLAVPRVADWCAVDILEDGELVRLAVVHSDPEKEKLAQEVAERWPVDLDETTGVPQVLRSGEMELYSEISDDLLQAAARDEEHLRVLREVGLRSAMIFPMSVGGRTLGAISFIAAESGRRYEASDLALAEKLASRAGIAVENARLYADAQRARDDAEEAQLRAEESRRAAEAANTAKSDFLAKMSHEIRTPLNAVIGYSDLLQIGIGGPLTDKQTEHLERIRASSQHLLGLVDEILDLARVESGRMTVQHDRIRVADSVAAALQLVHVQAEQRDVKVSDDCGEESTVYVGDADRVRQILVNITGNAIKFSPPGSSIHITCGKAEAMPGRSDGDGPWTFIAVRDEGIGIERDQLEAIFHPFVQAEVGYTRETEGTGLGLTISRQLALLMGGDVTAESTPGTGSTFTLWLPHESADEETVLWNGEAASPSPGLSRIGNVLIGEVDAIITRYRERLRNDDDVPMARERKDSEIEDHHTSLLSDLGASLVVLSEPGDAQERLMRDGSQIQRTVADLHGRQRAQLGWSQQALAREYEILWEIVESAIRSNADESDADIDGGLAVLKRFVNRAEKISGRGFRIAISSSGFTAR